VADAGNHAIRRITPAGRVSTLVGGVVGNSSGGFGSAKFAVPNDLVYDGKDGLYVVDSINHNVRLIDLKLAVVSTVAGSGSAGNTDDKGVKAKFNSPTGIARGTNGDLFVTDNQNHAIRRIDPAGNVTKLVGGTEGFVDGLAGVGRFSSPSDLVVRSDGSLVVADTNNHRIRFLK